MTGLQLRKRLLAFALAHFHRSYERKVADRKRALFTELVGQVLEIGPGTAPNLAYVPPGIHWIGIEPNPFMHPYARRRAAQRGISIDLRSGRGEQLDAQDASVDAVISTLVLCSVRDVEATLREIRRVLRPGGRFLFMEHVAAPPGSRARRFQRLIRPVVRCLADGCCPDRETGKAIDAAGFSSLRYERFTLALPIVGPHIAGVATK
jgi:ubiquinone/menaquinone biosynthesis C-methylase UbiE